MKSKFLIAAILLLSSCASSRQNKIAVQFSKNGPLHYVKYTEHNGHYYVKDLGREIEVKVKPGTTVYAGK